MSAALSAPDRLIVAAPSKGRLQENALAFFARAGCELQQGRGARDYRGLVASVEDAEAAFLSAGEITQRLARGEAHLGVTGEDLVREEIVDPDSCVELLTPLGFGFANVVVAAPNGWIDVRTMADLADVAASFRARHGRGLRVATKYVTTTRRFFSAQGIGDYRIVESAGATEGAPAAGAADLIVDITTTGATLAANGLRVLDDGVILRSQANLVASLKAPWGERAREAARVMLSRIAAEEEGRTTREIRAHLSEVTDALLGEAQNSFGARPHEGSSKSIAIFSAPEKRAPQFCDWLIAKGATSVTSTKHDYVFRADNPLWRKLAARIAG